MDNGKNEYITKRITVFGMVQGVGFRPLVYRIAQEHNIKGTVRNIGGLVEIITQSSQKDLCEFIEDIKANEYECEIVNIKIEDMGIEENPIDNKDIQNEEMKFSDFRIIDSSVNDEVSIIPPDLPVCPECQKELYTKSDRRFLNPFISCMSCGPRYTIIEELPYDRFNTTMVDFNMCPACQEEYTSPKSRRLHAQTISCNDCGPYLIFNELNNQEALAAAVNIIKSGGIVAVKGIGGYHFVCTPFIEDTVLQLRKLKGREEKPFAVMFESTNSVREFCVLSEEERTLIESKARPIVLLYTQNKSMADSTMKGSIYCGAFLPYTPLQIMLTKTCGPLIMTSANISNKPIIKDDYEMLSVKTSLLQGVLTNKRRIIRSVDDSVAKIIDHKPQIIRRSRGYVPYPIFLPLRNVQILAVGGDLKAAFCLYKKGNAVVSQYFGDLEERAVLDEYKSSVNDLSRLLKVTPEIVVCDLHPNYYSTKYAQTLNTPIIYVQHHHAHIASVMAEHDLKERVIGIAFDGTGYGTDGNIWGGEFLLCEGSDFKRAAHLRYTPILGGDQSMRDAKKTATCFLIDSKLSEYSKDNRNDIIEAALKHHMNTVLSSSMGRLFDAVASILDIQNENRYEGECAISLEKEAVLAKRNHKLPTKLTFAIKQNSDIIEIDPTPVLESICILRDRVDLGSLALGFHYAVVDVMVKVCEMIRMEQGINTIALSGGVFQNTILTELSLKLLREKGFHVYVNRVVPPNDGSISLGQTFIGLMKQ